MKRIAVLLVFVLMITMPAGCGKIIENENDEVRKIRVIDVDLTEEPYGIGVDKDKPELLEQVNKFIKKSRKSGFFDEIISHYQDGGEPVCITGAELDKERRDRQLVVASTLDFEPFEYGEVGEYYGIDMEIAAALAEYLGKELVIVNTSFETMFIAVNQHKCDICIGGITITKDRKKYVDFSEPYYNAAQMLAVPEGIKEFDCASDAKRIEEILREKDSSFVVGIENMTTAEEYCRGDEENGTEGFNMTITGYRDLETAVRALAEDECDYVIGDNATLENIVKRINRENGFE